MIQLYPYQKTGVKWIRHFKGNALLADEMGLGKTIQAIQYVKEELKGKGTVLVVCNANIKYNWQNEFRDHFGIRSEVLERSKPHEDRGVPVNRNNIYIINYDILKGWLPWLMDLKPDVIIGDEIQAIKNRTALRTKAFRKLCSIIPQKILLSGTPLENNTVELWSALNILKPKEYPSFHAFASEYSTPIRNYWGWSYKGARNTKELNRILKQSCMIRRLKKDVLKDLPSKTRTVIPVEIGNRKEYNAASKDFINWLAKKNKSAARNAENAVSITKMGYLKRLAAELKLPNIIQWIDDFLEQNTGKLIVFGHHGEILGPLYQKYKTLSTIVDGSLTAIEKQRRTDFFKKNQRCRILFGGIRSAGSGWNGTEAQTVLFAEMDWVPGKHVQAEDRIHRIGQTLGAMIYYLVAKDTIEEDLCEILQTKQKILDSVLDGQEGISGMNIYAELEAKLLRKRAA